MFKKWTNSTESKGYHNAYWFILPNHRFLTKHYDETLNAAVWKLSIENHCRDWKKNIIKKIIDIGNLAILKDIK